MNETANDKDSPIFDDQATVGAQPLNGIQEFVSSAITSAIKAISDQRDLDEVITWFGKAQTILMSNKSTQEIAGDLYAAMDSQAVIRILANTGRTAFLSYSGSGVPWAIKAALPVAAIGTALFGFQGVGIAAFGSAVGLPVVVILFIGTAGIASIIESLLAGNAVTDPLTKVLLSLVDLESKRRASKELLQALRADAMTPQKQNLPADTEEILTALRSMDPTDFERHVMGLFQELGYPAAVTLRSNDFGVDGFITYSDGVGVVQCKRNSAENPVGRPTVQQFKGVIEEQNAIKGFIVTTSRFTQEAIESAKQAPRIHLIDWQALVQWQSTDRPPF